MIPNTAVPNSIEFFSLTSDALIAMASNNLPAATDRLRRAVCGHNQKNNYTGPRAAKSMPSLFQ